MRIAIDLTAVRTTGMRNYLRGFVPALARVAPGHDVVVFVPPGEFNDVAAALPENFQVQAIAQASRTISRLFWQQINLPGSLARWKADVLFAPFDVAPLAAPCPVVLAVRNPSPIMAEQSHRPTSMRSAIRAKVQRAMSWASSRRAVAVIYPSWFAAEALGDAIGVESAKRRVVHHGTDIAFWAAPRDTSILAKYDVQRGEYFLFVSNLYRSKRPDTLIEAFSLYTERTGDSRVRLLFVGGHADSNFSQELVAATRRLGVADRVAFLGHIPVEDVAALYQYTCLFILPTLVETFGFPFVEAMAAGAPIVTADTPFAHEICGPAARFFPPKDSGALAQVIAELMKNKGERDRMVADGRRESKRFGWSLEAAGTLDLLLGAGRVNHGSKDLLHTAR